jgi:subtilase family serine protease
MPAGDFLACNLHDTPGQVDCTIAINLNVAPNGNPTTPASLLPGLHPADLQTAYAMPSSNSAGTVAIVDAYDDPTAEADLAVYRTAFGLPACSSSSGCFRRVNEYGETNSYPLPNTQWQEEMSLDMDMVSAICPNCKIVLVEANSPSIADLGTAVDTAASLGAVAVSNSYYAKEWKNERTQDVHYKHSGVAIVVSSGDQPGAFYPASSLSVTTVGGTSLSLSGGTRSESAWGPAGQGCSIFEPKPAFQPNTGCKTRSSVDMAAVADPQTGVTIWDAAAGGWLEAGGTSVGAPLVAAAYALSHNPRGPAYSYSHTSGFYDIPPAGYDLATGLGSPEGVAGL